MWNGGTIIDNTATTGLFEIGGTTLTTGTGIVVDAATTATAQGTLMGGGTILGDILDNGLVDLLNGQTLTIAGSVTGNGTLLLDGASVLEVTGGIAAGVSIVFDAGPGQIDALVLDTPLAVHGTIYDMGAGDQIDFKGVPFAGTSFSVNGDVLTITKGGGTIAALTLAGAYTTGSFSLSQDGSGNADIFFGQATTSQPVLTMPAELPAFQTSDQVYLAGASGIYVADPNVPINATYTLTLNVRTGTLFQLPSIVNTQTDAAGAHPMVFKGSLDQIQADLETVIWTSGGSGFSGILAPPDTITASLVRGDGVTVTGATGYDPAPLAPKIVNTGATTVALGQVLPLQLTPSDTSAAFAGNDFFGTQNLNTANNNQRGTPFSGYLLFQGGVSTNFGNEFGSTLAGEKSMLSDGNLLFVPTQTGTATVDGMFIDSSGLNGTIGVGSFSIPITVTAPTRTSPITDTWTGGVSAILTDAANWSDVATPGTMDTAVFAPIAGVPVILTAGDGVASNWDVDTSTTFAGVVDATGASGGSAFVVDNGATANFLPGSDLFAGNLESSEIFGPPAFVGITGRPIIVGETASGTLTARHMALWNSDLTIGNEPAAGGSHVTLTDDSWFSTGLEKVGGGGLGILDLIDTRLQNASAFNLDGPGFGQTQIGVNGGAGVLVSYGQGIGESVVVGASSLGELAASDSFFGGFGLQNNSLTVNDGRADFGDGSSLGVDQGLAGSAPAAIGAGGVLAGDDWTIEGGTIGNLTNDGTIEAASGIGGASTIVSMIMDGNGVIQIDAGATLDLNSGAAAATIGSGQSVVFEPEFDNAGGELNMQRPEAFAGTIFGFADGARIGISNFGTAAVVASATYDAGSNITSVDFRIGSDDSTIAFFGSLSAGNFALNSNQPAKLTVFDYVRAGVADQAPVLASPTDIAATDGVGNPIPGLSLSDADATKLNQTLALTFSSQNGGTFSAPAAAGLTITGEDSATLTVSGLLPAMQAELAAIDFTPATGIGDDTIFVNGTDGVSTSVPLIIQAHNSAVGNPDYTGTNNYIYDGPRSGSFDAPGAWRDAFGNSLPSGPGIADSATIDAQSLTNGGEDAIGGIGIAGQLLTKGVVVLDGTLTLAGLGLAGVGTIDGTGPTFAGALKADTGGELILAAAAKLSLGGDLIVAGEMESIADNPWSVAGNIDINGGLLRPGGLGGVTVGGTVMVSGTTDTNGVAIGGELDLVEGGTTLASKAAVIGGGVGTSTAIVAQNWAISGALIVGAGGDGQVSVATLSGSETISASSVILGQSAGVSGTLSAFEGGTLAVATTLTVGGAGDGTLDLTSEEGSGAFGPGGVGDVVVGSTASPGELDVGAIAGGTGVVNIATDGTVLVNGSAWIGGTSAGASGSGTLVVSGKNFGDTLGLSLIDVTGGLTLFNTGHVLLREGSAALGSLSIMAGGTLSGDGFVDGLGGPIPYLTAPNAFTTIAPVTPILDNGLIEATVNPDNGAALLLLYGDVAGTGTIEIAAGATVDIQGSVAAGVHVVFDGTGGQLILSEPAAFLPSIDGFQAGDTIRMAGVAPGVVAYNVNTGTLTDTVGAAVYTFTFDPPSGAFAALSDTHAGSLLGLVAGPVINAPGSIALGKGISTPVHGVSLTASSTETGDTFSVTLSDTSGQLSASGAGVSGSPSTGLTITGTVAAINAALLTLSDTQSIGSSDTITINATDITQGAAAPATTIAATVNGPPVITVPGTTVAFDQTTPTAIGGISLSETGDTSVETFTAMLTDQNGALSVTGSGATVSGSGTNNVTIAGSLPEVNAALGSLIDADTITGSDTITVNATDGFGVVATARSVPVTVSGLTPVIYAPGTFTIEEGLTRTIFGITLTEIDNADGETFTATLTDTQGVLAIAANSGTIVVTGQNSHTITVSGSLNDVGLALDSLTDTDPNTAPDSITINASDSFGNVAAPKTITIISNSAPILTAPPEFDLGINQTMPLAGLNIDETGNLTFVDFDVTLSDLNGQLFVKNSSVVDGSNVGNRIELRGSLAVVRAELATLTDTSSVSGDDAITFDASDSMGGDTRATIDVSVADISVITVPSAATATRGTATSIPGVSLSETDAASSEAFSVVLTDGIGVLAANTGAVGGGGTVTPSSGGLTLTISGSLDQVNADLTTLTDQTSAADTITVNASDSFGNSAAAASIAVTPTVVTGPLILSASGAAVIGVGRTTALTGFSMAETPILSGETFNVTLSDTDGVLSANTGAAGGGGAITPSGGSTTLTIVGSLAQVNADLTTLADTDAMTRPDTVFATAEDSNGGASGPTSTAVTVNGHPVIAAPAGVTIGVGVATSIGGVSLSETGDTDPPEIFAITLSDTSGQLTVIQSGSATINGSGTNTITVNGSLTDVNATLASLSDTDNASGSDTIAISASDSFGNAASPAQTIVTLVGGLTIAGSAAANVSAGNPTAVPGVSLTENNAQTAETFTVTLSDGSGLLSASGSGVSGSGTTKLTIRGSLSQVNSDLATLMDTDGTVAPDAILVNASDSFAQVAAQESIAVTVIAAGQTFTLTRGVDMVNGGPGDDTIAAATNTLTTGDQIDGGGGTNTLVLSGGGLFSLAAPTTMKNVQFVNAQEGQAANGSILATNQTVTLRSGMNVTVNVAAATINPSNPKAPTISIIGASDASVINLNSGNDSVTVGSASETVNGGTGADQIQVTATTIGAHIAGGTAGSTMNFIGGGTNVTMGGNITNIAFVNLVSSPTAMSFVANGIAGLVVNDANTTSDTVTAGGTGQTLTGGAAGKETFVGFTGGGVTFKDKTATITGDTIQNFFAVNSKIDITDMNSAAVLPPSFTGGVLTVTDGTHTAHITLTGAAPAGSFTTQSDTVTGTLIGFRSASG